MASKPPPSTAAGVPSGGNGPYIAIAVLLLLGIGAAVAWKLTQKPTEIRETFDAGPPAPPKPTGRNIEDDIPPPPVVEDAGDDGGKKAVVVQNAGSNGCDVKSCSGGGTPELETALGVRARQAHRCYDQALLSDSSLKGKVAIAVRVSASGQTCSAGVASNELSNPAVATCMAGYFRGQTFPAPRGGCADINVPINLLPPK